MQLEALSSSLSYTQRSLGSPGVGGEKGESPGASGYICFCQQRAPRAKQVLCDIGRLRLAPQAGTGQHAVDSRCWTHRATVSCSLFGLCPHSQTFCPTPKSDILFYYHCYYLKEAPCPGWSPVRDLNSRH